MFFRPTSAQRYGDLPRKCPYDFEKTKIKMQLSNGIGHKIITLEELCVLYRALVLNY